MERAARDWPVIVRLARPADSGAVLGFASTTWDGWDYIPNAWHAWLAASDGVVLTVTPGERLGGRRAVDAEGRPLEPDRPIAIARVALLSADEAWLEGIRVDPRVRGLGVGTDLQVAELRWVAALGATTVRYETDTENEASHRLGARHGFRVDGTWRSYGRVDPDHRSSDPAAAEKARAAERGRHAEVLARLHTAGLTLSPAAPSEVTATWWRRLAGDATFVAGHGLYMYRPWAMQRLTAERFAGHAQAGEVVVRDDGAGGWALGVLTARGRTAEDLGLHVSPLAGHLDSAIALLRAVEHAAGERARIKLPDPQPPLVAGREDAFTEAGFAPVDWTHDILARPVDAAHPPPDPDDAEGLTFEDPPRGLARAAPIGP